MQNAATVRVKLPQRTEDQLNRTQFLSYRCDVALKTLAK
jgi:hypothetical protein